MNKMRLKSTFARLGAILFFSLMVAGCASYPTEVRYDNSRQYFVENDEQGKKEIISPTGVRSRAAENENATAHYILRQNYSNQSNDKGQARKVAHPEAESPKDPKLLVGDMPLVLDASSILFEFDKAVIKVNFAPELDRWADFLIENNEVEAVICGHTDSIGEEKYNQDLSLRRAQSVVDYLINRGVNPNNLSTVGLGEINPVSDNETEEGRQKNRRVELKL
jgi:outer membrane protein OmpA-like peptidoglycan-associated protein